MDRREILIGLIKNKFGGSQAEFARGLKKSPAQVNQWVLGYRAIGHSIAREIEEKLRLPFGYMDGKTEPFINENQSSNIIKADIGTKKIPLINFVQAGMWREVSELGITEWLLTDLDLSARAFAVQIKGDSMLPDFRPGDRVIIDPEVAPQPGDFVVAKNGEEEATFKKYRPRGMSENGITVFELVPLNDDYPSIRNDECTIEIVGTMVEHRRYRKKT